MSTLAEIESAAAALSPQEKAELLLFVASQLRAEGAPLPEPRPQVRQDPHRRRETSLRYA